MGGRGGTRRGERTRQRAKRRGEGRSQTGSSASSAQNRKGERGKGKRGAHLAELRKYPHKDPPTLVTAGSQTPREIGGALRPAEADLRVSDRGSLPAAGGKGGGYSCVRGTICGVIPFSLRRDVFCSREGRYTDYRGRHSPPVAMPAHRPRQEYACPHGAGMGVPS